MAISSQSTAAKRSWWWAVFALLAIGLAVASVAAFHRATPDSLLRPDKAAHADGRVVENHTGRFDCSTTVVEFRVDDTDYYTVPPKCKTQFLIGDAGTAAVVYYLPGDPAKNWVQSEDGTIPGPSPLGDIVGGVIAGVVSMFFLCITVLVLSTSRRRRVASAPSIPGRPGPQV